MANKPVLSKNARAVRRILESARQSRLSRQERKKILAVLGRIIAVKPISPRLWSVIGTGTVRLFEHAGKKVAVKLMPGAERFAGLHGFDYAEHNKFYIKYRRALKKGTITPEKYVLVRLRPFGTFRSRDGKQKFLVMELVAGGNVNAVKYTFSASAQKSLELAQHELRENLRKLGGLFKTPQFSDSLLLGNTNPSEPEKGKWVFALPHDYA